MRRPLRLAASVVSLVGLAAAIVALSGFARADFAVASFSNMSPGGAINGWEQLSLGDAPASDYALVREGGRTVVRAQAEGSASGLIRRVEIDPNRFPVMSWRWRAENVIPGADIRRKGGDDYPARIYVTFAYDPADLSFGDRLKYRALRALGYGDIPVRALSYVWANRSSETRIVPNAFTDWVQMVPVRSGSSGTGAWQTERRDVVADYRAAFGEEPPPISGVAIMTDADNTGGSATAYFGDIRMTTR